jgi:oligopeptide/dipeptide ABC transporter ATP-binding protein
MAEVLLEVKNLKKYFLTGKGLFSRQETIRAVDGIGFFIKRGETLGLVGESGCGKTTTGKLILRLLEPTDGQVLFHNEDIFRLDKLRMKTLRRKMQIIFQDPFASLDPRKTVGYTISEPLKIHRIAQGSTRLEKTLELAEKVGLTAEQVRRYPHEFSGGQRQRIGIARALAVNPEFVVADEPVSALDVSIQAQIINLMMDLQEEFDLTYLFIAHDLSVVKHASDRVAIMYLGKIVELASKDELFKLPQHPYTQALLSANPIPNPRSFRKQIILEGDVPSPINLPPGCRFHTRCSYVKSICQQNEPELKDIGNHHLAACHLF